MEQERDETLPCRLLSSNGGDMDASLGVARIAHEYGMPVMVRTKCLSGCAVVALSAWRGRVFISMPVIVIDTAPVRLGRASAIASYRRPAFVGIGQKFDRPPEQVAAPSIPTFSSFIRPPSSKIRVTDARDIPCAARVPPVSEFLSSAPLGPSICRS
jgi:hypothetical protein